MATVPTVSLRDFDVRRADITADLMRAATEVGFFSLSDHGISKDEVDDIFALSKAFFTLSDEIKGKTKHNGKNAGWEKNQQVRPSTGIPDEKESIQLQFARMEGMWPSEDDIPGFRLRAQGFMQAAQRLSCKVMECFADGLGLPLDTFTTGTVDPGVGDSQSVLRLLHYHPTQGKTFPPDAWRAGAHTDFDILTLLFQRTGENGLEVCPGREVLGDYGINSAWTPVEAREDLIVCNIGDQLMRWSDDRLKSNYHRVKMPAPDEYQGSRYSIAFFNQARSNVIIQGPEKKYPPITGEQFIAEALARNNLNLAAKTSASK